MHDTAGYLERAWSVLNGKREDASAVRQAIAEARAREQRLDNLLGPPPTPPAVPKVRPRASNVPRPTKINRPMLQNQGA